MNHSMFNKYLLAQQFKKSISNPLANPLSYTVRSEERDDIEMYISKPKAYDSFSPHRAALYFTLT